MTFVWQWMDLEISMLSEITRLRKTNTTCFLLCVKLDLKLCKCVNIRVEGDRTRKGRKLS